MRLTVKYGDLEDRELDELRQLLADCNFKLKRTGSKTMLFVDGEKDDMLKAFDIATRFSYQDLMLRCS